jgi:ferredoxin-NAD(P)+ reductase (naphthalene dioxygenase ferredoxin-specific)
LADYGAMPIIVAMEATLHPLRRVLQLEPGADLLYVPLKPQAPVSYSRLAGHCGTCR